jgi:AraC-like DNA-binding protein
MEFEPLGIAPGETGFVLHETGYWPLNRRWNFPNVYSPFWRVYYDYKPGHVVRFGPRVTPLGPDRLLVVPNHQRFDCVGDEPVPSLWFSFSTRRSADPRQPMPIRIPINATLAALIAEFPPLFQSRRADKRDAIYRHSLAFILYVLGRPQIRWQLPLPAAIARIVEAINADPAARRSNPAMAREACMSPDAFIRSFRRWMDRTPGRYVAEVRVREACRFLRETERTIDAIAGDLGFPDRFYFSRVFKRHTALSPARYRRVRRDAMSRPPRVHDPARPTTCHQGTKTRIREIRGNGIGHKKACR